MEYLFTILLQNRKFLYSILRKTPREELFQIPDGFRNHIYWNIAHVVVTQQLITYGLSNLSLHVGAELVAKYSKGTVPESVTVSTEELEELQKLLFSTLEQTQQDYRDGHFKAYQSYTTSANVTLTSVEEALAFNVYHEGLHLGAILALQKALSN
ncbi:DinB family protein [Lentiprolixibacter aurantiacus]|uniref:DinB family protein n=1 Tax=Lentiprolixibacter aurantiacus TaxID=2993939 RepID=A0AAE3SND3_9FLAO|nr:DinB family protein [Lentiprolixibacter aurantiacus]MCX2718337.1 DinB family protein [Lentiprolixibacter aurantiacus]